MAIDKFQHKPNHDNPHHTGWRTNTQRLETALAQEDLVEQVATSLAVFRQLDRVSPEMADYHFAILHNLGLLEQG
jgi:hypothetical protein